MKTKITLVLLLTIFAYTANAQFQSFFFGLKAAPQLTWMKPDVDNMKANGTKMGFAWGFVAEKNFTENYSITSGFNMLFNGGKLTISDVASSTNREYFLKYIEVPVSLKMRTNPISGIRYFGRVGFGTAFKIGSKVIDEVTPTDGPTTTSLKKNYDKISFVRESLVVGVGAEYELNEGPRMGVEFTFNNGLTNILTEKNEKAMPNYFELAFSVLF